MRNLDALQYSLDTLVYLAQRFADITPIALVTLPARGHARRNEKRTIDGLDYLKSRNRVRRTGERVAAVGTVLRLQQASFSQPLQNLGQRLWRNAVGVGYVLGTTGAHAGTLCQMLHRHQGVVGLFCQLQQRLAP